MQPSPSTRDLSTPSLPNVAPELLEQAWFDAPRSVRRASTLPPPKAEETVGEFLGDELADAWLR